MKRALPFVTAAAVAGFAACASAQELKIGFLTTLSGPAAAVGQDMMDGFKLGLRGIEANVKVSYDDDQLRPDVGRQVIERYLDRERMDIVTGMPWSNVLLATAKPVLDSGALLISSNAGPSELAGRQCHPNFFAVGFQNDTPHEAMGKYAAEKGFKRIYLLAPNYPAGKDALAGFKRFYKEPLAGEIYTPLNQLDYAADLAQLRAAKPDAVYFFYAGGMGANFLKQYRQADLPKDIPLLGPIFSLDNIIVTATGDAALGARASTFWSEVVDNPANKRFVTDFKAAYGRPPTSYAATSYDTAMLIKSAVQKLGKGVSDRKTLREELLKANFESVRGPFRFNTNQFPVQDFFVADLVKDANGRVMVGPGTRVMEKHVDAYASLCKLITN